jgi:hypothetical protein
MAIVINGSGTITGISVGGLPDGVVDSGTLATDSVDSSELVNGAVDDSHLATPRNYKLVTANYDISTASGTQDITGFGFDPTFVIAFVAVSNTFSSCMGMTEVGTSNYSVGSRGSSVDHFPNGAIFIHVLISAGNNCSGVATTITDGIRLTWTKNGTITGTANMYFMGFE